MRLAKLPLIILFFLTCLFSCDTNHPAEENRVRNTTLFNTGWRFSLDADVTAAEPEYDDSDWAEVKLPHDWSIEGTISKDNPSGHFGGFYPGGIGFYRKTFPFDPDWEGKTVSITFDGVMSNSEVWINGHSLGTRPNGYVGFTYDLTPYLSGEGNLIVVKADNSSQPNSRWYTGAGIYRNVWLTAKNKVSIAQHGTYVVADNITTEQATIQIETTIENTTKELTEIEIVSVIVNPEGEKVAEAQSDQSIRGENQSMVHQQLTISNPSLWSLEDPSMYLLKSTLLSGSEVIDEYETPFGVREIRFEVESGFWLNGENIKVKGVNNHHDGGPVGAAVPDDVLHRRLKILKEMGCNAIRTAHNPFSPEFYHMADTMGFLVMDEVFDEWIASWPWVKYENQGKVKYGYHNHFEEWAQQDLADIILRDRNHPSIFMWSVGNEIPDQCYPEGPERLAPLMETVRRLDSTRPITAGCCFIHLANASGFSSQLEVTGYNGGGGSVFYEKDKALYPDRKFIATEIPHSFQTRGYYQTMTEMRSPHQGIRVPDLTEEEVFPELTTKFYSSSYDNSSVRISARDSWRRTDSLDYVAGEFRWTGFDYLGESIKGWPARFFNFGIIDLCGFPKDHYYFYQSQWTTVPMVHILPHWTWEGKEGMVIPVWTYSNAEEVELFLNETSLGTQSTFDKQHLSWDVPYQPGELKAIARTNGEVVSEDVVKTAGPAVSIELTTDKTDIEADGFSCIHLEVNLTDEEGNFVPNADHLLKFEVTGPAINIGLENGDPLDLTSTKLNQRRVFNGKALLILQNTGEEGQISVQVRGEGLQSAELILEAN